MASDTMQQELTALRAQLEALKAEREASEEATGKVAEDTLLTDEAPPAETEIYAQEFEMSETELTDQLKELIETLEKEISDANPKALIAVFALGILIGRLLPR